MNAQTNRLHTLIEEIIPLRWDEISNYRNELFGLSIISIILFHYCECVANADSVNKYLGIIAFIYNAAIGSIGVDIFLFLSGFGIWHSLKNNPSATTFYSKRIKRVVIPYIAMGGLFWLIKDLILGHSSFAAFLYDFTLLSFWCDGTGTFWYISLICLVYLFSPIIYKNGNKAFISVSIASIIFSVILFFVNNSYFLLIEVALLRIPIYFLGMYCASLAHNKVEINWIVLSLLAFSVPVKIIAKLIDFPFTRLTNAGYAIFLVILYIVLRHIYNIYKGRDFLIKTGAISLELYIAHVAVRNIVTTLGLSPANPFIYAMCIIIAIPIAILFSGFQHHR